MVLLATKAGSLARVGAYGGIFLKMAYNLFGPRVDPHANEGANGSIFPSTAYNPSGARNRNCKRGCDFEGITSASSKAATTVEHASTARALT